MSLRLVIFDMDDTLLLFDSVCGTYLECAYDKYKKSLFSNTSCEDLKKAFATILDLRDTDEFEDKYTYTPSNIILWELALDKLAIKYNAYDLYSISQDSLDMFDDMRKPISSIKNLLDFLKSKGICLVVVSKGFCEWKCAPLKRHNLLQYFDKVIGTTTYKVSKETGEAYKYVLSLYNLKAEECLVVGNSFKIDIEPARELGINAIQVDFEQEGSTEKEGIIEDNETGIFSDYKDVLLHLEDKYF